MTRWRILGTESGVQNGGGEHGGPWEGVSYPLMQSDCQWLGLASTTFVMLFFIGRIDVVCSRRTYIVHMNVEKPGRAVAWPA